VSDGKHSIVVQKFFGHYSFLEVHPFVEVWGNILEHNAV
jgi:hypothetical protein